MSFAGAGKAPGLEIWRIEKMVPVVWTDHGKFCSGDSYIVLKTSAVPGKTSLQWDIHFWLGTETSQDEAGVAAYKTVELDEQLGGAPVQHREVQGFESEKFLSYFKQGVQYISGGVESGFTKVERDKYETRLLQCKGVKSVRVSEVPINVSSLNSGDVFVLDCGLTLYQWNGKDANRKEKAKGLDVSAGIKNNERGGRAKVVVLDQGSETEDFWTALGGKGQVAAGDPKSDNQADEAAASRKLLRVALEGGSVTSKTVAEGTFKKAHLDTNGVFILDAGNPVLVWVGKGASDAVKKESMVLAQKFLEQEKKPRTTRVTKVIEGGETPLFREQFADWVELRTPADFTKVPGAGSSKKVEQKEINVDELLKQSSNPADTLVDDGSGKLDIWRIKNFDKEPVPKELYGRFYAGDSYICLYTYKQGTKECYIIYFWQGRNSTADEKGTSAILATKLDDDLHGAATQVRVVQGKEPAHFLSLFKGKLIIYSGGTASGFKNKADADSFENTTVQLFHVKGTNALNTRAVQIETSASRLSSGDVFIVRNSDNVIVWFGKGSNQEERKCGKALAEEMKASTVFRKVVELEEGSEDFKFWNFLGGKQPYSDTKELVESPHEPRLFQCSNATGRLVAEEVFEFSQDDLDHDDVFLLDVYSEIYVWIGKGANEEERKQAMGLAQKFIDRTPGRSETAIVQVPAGREPPMFTSAFLGWDSTVAQGFEDPYEKKLRLMKEQGNTSGNSSSSSSAAAAGSSASSPAGGESASAAPVNYADPASTHYSYEQLLERPANVDPKVRELYLSDDDFVKHFKMSKSEFASQKQWKKDQLKKEKKLF